MQLNYVMNTKKCVCYEITHQAAIFAHQIKSGKLFRDPRAVTGFCQGEELLVL